MAKDVKIVKSKTAPVDKNVLWDDGENLKINRDGKWESTGSGLNIDSELMGYLISPPIIKLGDKIPEVLYDKENDTLKYLNKNISSAYNLLKIKLDYINNNTFTETKICNIHYDSHYGYLFMTDIYNDGNAYDYVLRIRDGRIYLCGGAY